MRLAAFHCLPQGLGTFIPGIIDNEPDSDAVPAI